MLRRFSSYKAACQVSVLLLVLGAEAQALAAPRPLRERRDVKEIATDPDHPGPVFQPSYSPRGGYERHQPDVTAGLVLAFGRTRQKYSQDGFYGRIAPRLMVQDADDSGPTAGGAPLSIDFWRSPNGWGVGFPTEFHFGYATPHLMAFGSLGWSLLSIDHERDRTGFGFLSPLAGLSAGLSLDPVRIMLDARAVYRWHIKTVDTPQTQLGVSIEFFSR